MLEFNHADDCRRAIEANGDELSAVIVEPVHGGSGCLPPAPGYLEMLREVTRRHGILLIFDETYLMGIAPLNKGFFARGRGIVTAAHRPRHVQSLVRAMERVPSECGLAR